MALITLDKKAYEHNLSVIARKAGGFDKVICVLKDNAYGHGTELIAPLAKNLGVNFIALKDETQAFFCKAFSKTFSYFRTTQTARKMRTLSTRSIQKMIWQS